MPSFACMELMWGGVEGPKFEPWLDEVRALGFEGVAVRAATLQPWLRNARRFRALLAARDLALAGVYLPWARIDAGLDAVCAWMQAAGCLDLILHGGRAKDDADRAASAQRIDAWGARAAKKKVRVCYHHHSDSLFETLEETEALLRATHPTHVGAFIDTGHATQDFAGHPIERRALIYLERNWPRMHVIEFKGWSEARGLCAELGEGPADLPAVAAFLRAQQFDGWITLEQNAPTPGSTAGACAARNLAYARRLFPSTAHAVC